MMSWEAEYGSPEVMAMFETMLSDGIEPEALKERPDIAGYEPFYSAFHELGTERSFGFSAGPIPVLSVVKYADEFGFFGDNRRLLFKIVRALDAEFLTNQNREMAKRGAK